MILSFYSNSLDELYKVAIIENSVNNKREREIEKNIL